MPINKYNYEAFFLDFIEGNLSPENRKELFEFLGKHPEYKSELNYFNPVYLETEEAVYTGKAHLKKAVPFWGIAENRRIRYAAAAAIALLIISIGWLRISNQDTENAIAKFNSLPDILEHTVKLNNNGTKPDDALNTDINREGLTDINSLNDKQNTSDVTLAVQDDNRDKRNRPIVMLPQNSSYSDNKLTMAGKVDKIELIPLKSMDIDRFQIAMMEPVHLIKGEGKLEYEDLKKESFFASILNSGFTRNLIPEMVSQEVEGQVDKPEKTPAKEPSGIVNSGKKLLDNIFKKEQ